VDSQWAESTRSLLLLLCVCVCVCVCVRCFRKCCPVPRPVRSQAARAGASMYTEKSELRSLCTDIEKYRGPRRDNDNARISQRHANEEKRGEEERKKKKREKHANVLLGVEVRTGTRVNRGRQRSSGHAPAPCLPLESSRRALNPRQRPLCLHRSLTPTPTWCRRL
jgi:hypothetical protein